MITISSLGAPEAGRVVGNCPSTLVQISRFVRTDRGHSRIFGNAKAACACALFCAHHLRITAASQSLRSQRGKNRKSSPLRAIDAAHFLPRPGIRFPQDGCVSCSYLGLCLGNQNLARSMVRDFRLAPAEQQQFLSQLHAVT